MPLIGNRTRPAAQAGMALAAARLLRESVPATSSNQPQLIHIDTASPLQGPSMPLQTFDHWFAGQPRWFRRQHASERARARLYDRLRDTGQFL